MNQSVGYAERLSKWEAKAEGDRVEVLPWLRHCEKRAGTFRRLACGERTSSSDSSDVSAGLKLLRQGVFYGVYGALEGEPKPAQGAVVIRDLLAKIEDLIECAPAGDSTAAQLILETVRARQAIDVKAGALTPAALALMAWVSERTVQNIMFGKNSPIKAENGLISAQNAEPWLKERSSFYPSIWNARRPLALTAQVRVPVARDGSTFCPALRRRGGFTIGAKGDEKIIVSFDDALAELQRQPVPRWRRKNAEGNWGIVSGTDWKTFERGDLEELDHLGNRPRSRRPNAS